jgi:hypothetical protein
MRLYVRTSHRPTAKWGIFDWLPSPPVPTGTSGATSNEGCMFCSSLSPLDDSSFSSTCYSLIRFSSNMSASNSSVTNARLRDSEFVFANLLSMIILWVRPYHSSWLSCSTAIGLAIVSSVVIPVSCTIISPPGNGAISATTSTPLNPESLAHVLYNYYSSLNPKGSIKSNIHDCSDSSNQFIEWKWVSKVNTCGFMPTNSNCSLTDPPKFKWITRSIYIFTVTKELIKHCITMKLF